MDSKLSEQLQQTLAALLANAQDAAAWTKGQIPSLVQEKIRFGRISETVFFLMSVAVFVTAVILCRRCIARLQDCHDEIGWILGVIVTGLMGITAMFALAEQCQSMLMVWFAPRLYIVEWLLSQVHK